MSNQSPKKASGSISDGPAKQKTSPKFDPVWLQQGKRIEKIQLLYGLTREKFAECLGLKYQTLSVYITGRRDISQFLLNRLEEKFAINRTWIKTGKGPLFLPTYNGEFIAHIDDTEELTLNKIILAYLSLNKKVSGIEQLASDRFGLAINKGIYVSAEESTVATLTKLFRNVGIREEYLEKNLSKLAELNE